MCTIIERNGSLTSRTEKPATICSPKNVSTKSLICRICFDNESGTDSLIRPCSCSGTVAYVHNGCLEQWVRATSNVQCTICQDEFELIPVGLKSWAQIAFPRPLSNESEDYMEFGCTLAWIVYMMRFAYIGLRHGSRSMMDTIDEAIGTGTLRSLWWFSFWFNFLYYGAMSFILYEKWLIDNTIFSFKDRRGPDVWEDQNLRAPGRLSMVAAGCGSTGMDAALLEWMRLYRNGCGSTGIDAALLG